MKISRFLVLGLLMIATVCHAEITDPGWFSADESDIQVSDADMTADPQPDTPSNPDSFKPNPLNFNPDPSAIAETITPEIQALANGLQNDWTQIFSYVHDHIRYVHYFGSMKGAQLTLLEKNGNDFDQCALLMALLRCAGYTNSTYGFGWMDMPYDDHTGSGNDLHHWLQLNFSNTNWNYTSNYLEHLFGNRGYPYLIANGTNDIVFQRVWVNLIGGGMNFPLDPAFKTYQSVAGISLTNVTGFSSNGLMNAAAGVDTSTYVSNLNETALSAALTGYTTNLLGYLQNNYPNASVEQILGGQDIIPGLSLGLQFQTYTVTIGGHSSGTTNWVHEPTNLMSSLKVTFAATNYFCWTPKLLGQRLSLTFDTTGLAQLWQDDTPLASKTTGGSSSTTNVIVSLKHPVGTWNFANNTLTLNGHYDQAITNSYQRTNATYALIYAFEPDWGWLRERENQLDMYRLQGLGDTSRQVVSEGLNIMGLNWALQSQKMVEMAAAQKGILPAYWHRFGRMAQESGNGYYVDVYMQLSSYISTGGSDAANLAKEQNFYDATAYFQSALEHGIIEQLQSSNLPAASTVKMLGIANANGQAVFLANSGNWTTVRAKLVNYTPAASNYLASAITAGYNILLPQNGSNHVAGAGTWAGFGYAARKVSSGSEILLMAISGLYNGGYSDLYYSLIDVPYLGVTGQVQPTAYSLTGPFTYGANFTIADPIDSASGTFQVDQIDLTLGQSEPKGISFSRYYNGTRRFSNPAGMAGGWTHNYYVNAATVAAPQAEWGGTTPAQAAPLLAATCAALNLYSGSNPDAKNWLVTALIAKWGIDQLSHNSVSIVMGKDTVQFVKQPNGVFTPPANCTMALTQSNGNYCLQQRHGNAFNFDSQGRLSTIVDQYGNNLSVTYLSGTSSLPYQVTDWKSRTLTFNYTGGQLTSVSDNSTPSRTIYYGYNSTNSLANLTSFTDAEGNTSTFGYDTNHQITAFFDALSHLVVSNVYDGFGHVMTQYTQGDTNKTWQICWSRWQTIEQNPAGDQQTYLYDDQSRLISLEDELGAVTQLFYDGQDHVVTNISPLSEIRRFVYDGNNNLVQTVDPLGFTNQFVYDTQNQLIRTVDPRGNATTFGYNTQFSLTGETNGAGDFLTLTYNSDGTLATKTDAGGQTQFNYDSSYGQLNRIIYPNSLGVETFVTSEKGDVTSHTDGNSNVTAFYFNKRRQLTNSVAPTNVSVRVSFDANGNVASTTDARSNVTTQTWSATRQLLTTTLPATPQGTPIFTNGYDSRDWLVRTADALAKPTLYTNDPAGRLSSVTDPILRTARFSYDKDGRKLTSANAGNETNKQTWDVRGDLVRQTDGAGHFSTRAYDAAGNQTTLTNRNTNTWKFYFDAANRLTNTVSPGNRSTVLTFNHQGLISTIKDPSNQITSLNYDAKGRLTSRTDNVASTVYGYDANDNCVSVVENGQTIGSAYDANNRVSSYNDANGNIIQYRYDANGNLTNLVYPGGRNVYYAYDTLNRLTDVTDWSGRKSSITYDLDSRITKIARPNGSYRTIGYDPAGQATNIMEEMSNSLPIAIFKYNWTNTGTIAWEFAAPLPHSNSVPTRTMTYDADNRLSTFKGASMGSPQSVGVDLNGNTISAPLTNDSFVPYAYDARNRLMSVGGVTNAYDAMNNRIGQAHGTNITSFVVNPNAKLPQVLMRIRNGITNYYIYGAGLLYQITESATGTNTLTYHYDSRGSTVALSADSGIVTDRVEYSLYGLMTYRAGTSDTPFLFNGKYGVQTDADGLLYMRARYYNPYLCRFINPDPSGFSSGLNLYAFCDGNPVSYLDPFGLGAIGENKGASWVGIYNSIASVVVPGQVAWNNAVSAFQNGHYGTAALDTANMVAQQILFVLTLGGSSPTVPALNSTESAVSQMGAVEETVTLYHGTTTSAARQIVNGGFKAGEDNAVFFAEDFSTAKFFGEYRIAETGANAGQVLRYTLPKSLAEEFGLTSQRVLGEFRGAPTIDIPGSSGFERILSGENIDLFNQAVRNGLISVKPLRIGY